MAAAARKPGAAAIRLFLRDLGQEPWLAGTRRSWWPRFAFHHTDVRNAAQVLNDGRLLSRSILASRKTLAIDSASPEVMASTAGWVRDYVRLYFRPRTPTQYRSEGIRLKTDLHLGGAHCPVPVFFLFDSGDVLTQTGCRFSNGNLGASSPEVGHSVEFLRTLDFQKIYSVGPHDPADRSITFSRNAEVIVRDELPLRALARVVARTPAERQTLLGLLDASALRKWQDKIVIDGRSDLFDRRWTFIERADLSEKIAILYFSPDTLSRGPFVLHVEVQDLGTSATYTYDDAAFLSDPEWALTIPEEVWSYRLSVTLDGHLAFRSDFFAELPF